ncbi:hypothetical protein Bealeia1_00004 [Candidatus Bealeia paramacronuclearis]|uniref:Uncharacterized protein n=1 Tax=Candidatus Bealeia paramacronuclearis TaxID=1921001 RepID=A0ABZ2C142_9PROT|nr:hypothetical protein [Candidatus Bealeia paramacronuclearis]
MKKQLIISTIILFSAILLTNVHDLKSQTSEDCQKIYKGYLDTVGQFYDAANALNNDTLYQKYPKFLAAVKAATLSRSNLANAIKTYNGQIQGAYTIEKNSDLESLAGVGMKRLQGQVDSIENKIDKWKSTKCKAFCNCLLGSEYCKNNCNS